MWPESTRNSTIWSRTRKGNCSRSAARFASTCRAGGSAGGLPRSESSRPLAGSSAHRQATGRRSRRGPWSWPAGRRGAGPAGAGPSRTPHRPASPCPVCPTRPRAPARPEPSELAGLVDELRRPCSAVLRLAPASDPTGSGGRAGPAGPDSCHRARPGPGRGAGFPAAPGRGRGGLDARRLGAGPGRRRRGDRLPGGRLGALSRPGRRRRPRRPRRELAQEQAPTWNGGRWIAERARRAAAPCVVSASVPLPGVTRPRISATDLPQRRAARVGPPWRSSIAGRRSRARAVFRTIGDLIRPEPRWSAYSTERGGPDCSPVLRAALWLVASDVGRPSARTRPPAPLPPLCRRCGAVAADGMRRVPFDPPRVLRTESPAPGRIWSGWPGGPSPRRPRPRTPFPTPIFWSVPRRCCGGESGPRGSGGGLRRFRPGASRRTGPATGRGPGPAGAGRRGWCGTDPAGSWSRPESPTTPVVRAAVAADPAVLSDSETAIRRQLDCPPFASVALGFGSGGRSVRRGAALSARDAGPDPGAPHRDQWLVKGPTSGPRRRPEFSPRPAERLRVAVDPGRL